MPEYLLHFRNYLNSEHSNMSFSIEIKTNNEIYSLDVKVSRKNGRFKTTINQLLTFTLLHEFYTLIAF